MQLKLLVPALALISATAVADVPEVASPQASRAMAARPLQVPVDVLRAGHPALTRYAKRVGEIDLDRTAFQARRSGLGNLVEYRKPAAGGHVTLEVFPGEEYEFVGTRVEESKDGIVTWTGVPASNEYGHLSVTVRGPQVRGTLDVGRKRYTFRDGPGGRTFIREVDHKLLPGEPPADELRALQDKSAKGDPMSPGAASGKVSSASRVFDVMVLYTPAVASNNGGDPSVSIANFMADLNSSFVESNIDAAARVVHKAQLSYSEPSGMTAAQHIAATEGMRDATGSFSTVSTLRDTVQADLVVLLVAPAGAPAVCGYSLVPPETVADRPKAAYATVDETCATTDYTFTHEIGHSLWGHHDWTLDGTSNPVSMTSPPNHGYTYTLNDGLRALMGSLNFHSTLSWAGDKTCDMDGCPRLLRWEDPSKSVVINGSTYALGSSGSTTTDMATTIGVSVLEIAAYRSASIPAPSAPGSASVTSYACYGANEVSWAPVVLNTEYYDVQTSTSSSFLTSSTVYSGPSLGIDINVTGTRYVRVRACNTSAGCSAWTNASGVATYTAGCM